MRCHKTYRNLRKLTLSALTIAVLSVPSLSQDWYVIDGGWCDLVYVPLPKSSQSTTSTRNFTESASSPSVTGPPSESVAVSETVINLSMNEETSEEGFESLFNGENLDGWIIQGLEKAGPKVEDGVMVVGGWDYWAVITKEEYKNFILRFDVKFEARGNSGILLHTDKKEVFKNAPEVQLRAVEPGESAKDLNGAIFDNTGLKIPQSKHVAKPTGEWNSVEIKSDNSKLWVAINGTVVQDGIDLNQSGLKHKNEKGPIAIQRNDYKKAAFFKNIRIKRLPD